MSRHSWCRCFFASVFCCVPYIYSLGAQANPFLRPGDLGRKPPPTVRPAPPPPAPKPINSNLELRGFFKFQEIWHFAIFDKVKNRGFWLKKGESFDDGKVQIESFNLDTESIKMKGGQSLTLKSSQHRVMPVPSAQPVKKKTPSIPAKSPIRLPKAGLPRVKIPARSPTGTPRP
jgi:hypothetical protein